MTKKQMETAIKDLQKQMLNLASRTGNRDAENESKIGTVDMNVSQQGIDIATNKDAADEHEAQLLYQICLIQLGLDDEDFDDEDVEE